MNDLVVSINKNVLKLTAIINDSLQSFSIETPKDSINDSKIVNVEQAAELLGKFISDSIKVTKKKFSLSFIVEPQDVFLSFVTVNKNGTEIEEQIVNEFKTKLRGENLEDMYFSYEKIAPFVYQVAAIKKEVLETYIQLSNILGIPLKAVIPWVLLLPKYVNTNDSAIFISKTEDDQVVALSELGGIYFTGVYEVEKNTEELQKLVQELSVYKRAKPIDIIYTLNYETFSLAMGYSVRPVDVPNLGEVQPGFEINILANYMLDFAPDLINSQTNLLTLIPVPVVEKKSLSLVQVGSAIGAFIIVGVLIGGFMYLKGVNGQPQPDLVADQTSVLSSVDEPTEATASEQVVAPVLKKEELSIRVENGSGINGIAAKSKTSLEKFGYKVLEIDTAAQNEDTTVLRFKKSKIAYKDLLVADSKDIYPDAKVEDTLEETATYDLLIIVGTNVELE
ncbi:hypothetical protein A2619_03160 [candidate division WWE3 bacterium RIFOXYD1_FULL_39_9]|uniref:LytR/CpsA/Psr regulator C-terminal domain-containing protein n=1 Tax=candidate division WWE3 bacterium RIFOXYD1_FULL_39_9 TaxID=1802649 RepID=A0A1F4X8Q0_UNCKA|nr:MAG: hypothetical protein A2619_03160 [candidate division WWE3 bacterium RIFOXYD1_FULL_39_9]